MIKLPLKRKQNRVYLTPEVAHQILPKELQPGVNVSTITGLLHVKDNLHDIKVLDNTQSSSDSKDTTAAGTSQGKRTAAAAAATTTSTTTTPAANRGAPTPEELFKKVKYEWGPLDVDLFVKKLIQDGITDIRVEQPTPGCVLIVLLGQDTHIRLEEGNTHIVCGGKQSLRLKLRDLLMQCVQKF